MARTVHRRRRSGPRVGRAVACVHPPTRSRNGGGSAENREPLRSCGHFPKHQFLGRGHAARGCANRVADFPRVAADVFADGSRLCRGCCTELCLALLHRDRCRLHPCGLRGRAAHPSRQIASRLTAHDLRVRVRAHVAQHFDTVARERLAAAHRAAARRRGRARALSVLLHVHAGAVARACGPHHGPARRVGLGGVLAAAERIRKLCPQHRRPREEI